MNICYLGWLCGCGKRLLQKVSFLVVFSLYCVDRELHISHYFDEELFKDYSFMEAFNFSGPRNFFFEKHQEMYFELVRIFYASLTYKNGVISSYVKKYPIFLYLEDFTQA